MSFLDSMPIIGARRKIKEAERIVKRAKWRFEDAQDDLTRAQEKSKSLVTELAELKIVCAQQTIPEAAEALSRCQKVNLQETKTSQTFSQKFEDVTVPHINEVSTSLNEVVSVGIKGTSAGAALALGSVGLVSSFGAASTGTSIAALSGVAAKNATIAWFGGGALSAGGAGVAGGALALGGIALLPVAVFGAFKYSKHAEEQMTEAKAFRDKVDVEVEKINATISIAEALNNHVELCKDMIEKMQNKVEELTQQLIFHLEQEPRDNEIILVLKQQIILFVKTLKKLISISLIREDSQPSNYSLKIVDHINNLNDENVTELLQRVNNNIAIKPKNNIKYLQNITPGVESPTYFWLQDVYPERPSKSASSSGSLIKDFFQMIVGTGIFAGLGYYLVDIDWLFLGYTSAIFAASIALVWFADLFNNKLTDTIAGTLFIGVTIFFALKYFGFVL